MPVLSSNDQSIGIAISTTADTKGAEDTSKSIDKLTGTVEDANKKTSNFAAQFSDGLKKASIATGVAGAALTIYAKSATDTLTGLVGDSKTLSRETGLTTEQSSQLLAVTKRLGIGTDQASASFGILSKNISEARSSTTANALQQEELKNKIAATKLQVGDLTTEMKKNGDKSGDLHNKLDALNIDLKKYQLNLDSATSPLQKINVATTNADGSARSFNQILLDISDRFKNMPNGAEKTALAMELFGRSGKDMIKVLNLGSDGIQKLEDNADKLGLTLTTKNITAVQKYVEANKKLQDSNEALKLQVGTEAIPMVTAFKDTVNDLLQKLLQTDGATKDVTVGILAFGGPILSASAGALGLASNLTQVVTGFNEMKIAGLGAMAAIRGGFISLMALLATPVMMGGIVIAGALADLALVTKAAMTVRQAIQDINAAADAKVSAGNGALEGIADAQAKYKAGKITKAQEQKMIANYTSLADAQVQKRATGGPVSAGQPYVVGDNPDGSWNDTTEVFVPRQSGTIMSAGQSRGMMGGTQITIQQATFNTADAVNAFFDLQNRNSVLASKGLSTIGNA